ncbi:MAG: DUF4416 family protein [bacterium]
MGIAKNEQPPVKLFFALTVSEAALFETIESRLALEYGPIDWRTEPFAFNHTGHYEKEMGPNLVKKIFSVTSLMLMPELAEVKIHTNRVENLFLNDRGGRRINLDPGYLSLCKVVLATTKDYDHRIYVGGGIFEEVTLTYKKEGGFQPWPWTYPDYRAPKTLSAFNALRELYREQLKNPVMP